MNETLDDEENSKIGEYSLNPLESNPEEKNPLDDDDDEEDKDIESSKTEDVCDNNLNNHSETETEDKQVIDASVSDKINNSEEAEVNDEAKELNKEDSASIVFPETSEQVEEKNYSEVENNPISEEDLLTGPAHNLDDSQFKADYVDPNLEDIFK